MYGESINVDGVSADVSAPGEVGAYVEYEYTDETEGDDTDTLELAAEGEPDRDLLSGVGGSGSAVACGSWARNRRAERRMGMGAE